MKKVLKWIGRILLILVACFVLYVCYFVFIHKDVPKTSSNVNHLELGELQVEQETATNVWKDEIKVEKGSLVVLENRAATEGNKIQIHFTKITSSNNVTGTPIFFLAGGPGTPGSSLLRRSFFYVFEKLSQYTDVVLIDQRGTGSSIPNLRCRNQLDLPTKGELDWEQAIFEDIRSKCAECADEFEAMGIDLQAYNTKESAFDIEEIRKVLGYDEITLFGYSYGTSLAQQYLKAFENHVDKVILAAPTAPDLSLKLPSDQEYQLHMMDSIIQADPRMRRHIPDLAKLMNDVHGELNKNPLQIKLPLMDAVAEDDGWFLNGIFRIISFFKPSWDLTMSDTHLKMMMAQNVGRSAWTRIAPWYYYQLSQDNYNRLGNYLRNFRRQAMPNALFFSVAGSTLYSEERWQKALEESTEYGIEHFHISFGRFPEILKQFEVEQIPGLSDPVHSDKKVLLIGGTLDGRTPISNLDTLSNRFPNNSQIIIENGSHDDLIDGTVLDQIIEFTFDAADIDTVFSRDFHFVPLEEYAVDLSGELEQIRQQSGMEATIDSLEIWAIRYDQDSSYSIDLGESALNNYGYQLLNSGAPSDAVKIFNFCLQKFSTSYNAHNSLAEGYIASEDYEKASIHLEKAIELNYLDGYSHALLRGLNTRD